MLARRPARAGTGSSRCDEGFDDLLAFYAAHMRPGMVDLSSSGAPPRELRTDLPAVLPPEMLNYVPPASSPELRGAIAARYSTVEANDVLVCAGASEALVACALTLLGRGDRLVAVGPAYPSLTSAAAHSGATVDLVRDADSCLPARAIAVSNPTTPDGRLLDLELLAGEAARVGAVLIADEVYRDLVLEGEPPVAAADLSPSAISIGDLSKPLGLGGLRIGWIATRDASLRNRLDRQLQLLSGGPATLSVVAARAAFERFDHLVGSALGCARGNLPGIAALLSSRGWSFVLPEAGPTFLARPPVRPAATVLNRLDEAGLFLLPGSVFGVEGSYRVSLFAPLAELARALAIVDEQPFALAG